MNDPLPLRILRGIANLAATVALVVGVPVALVTRVGWPLPTKIPTLDGILEATRVGVTDQLVVKILAVVAWIAWSQLAVAVIAEVVALARGVQPARMPLMPGFQAIAARLVAGIITIGTLVQPAVALAATPPLPIPALVLASTTPTLEPATPAPSFTRSDVTPIRSGEPASVDVTALPTVAVQRHDSYWAIAERTLGDGIRWREIRDLNIGRTFDDGTTITADDDILRTGWVLRLPPDAVQRQASTMTDAGSVEVKAGDNLWTIAEAEVTDKLDRPATEPEVADYWSDLVHENESNLVRPGDPDLILPGQQIDLPAAAGLTETIGPPAASPTASVDEPVAGAEPAREAAEPVDATTSTAPTTTVTTTSVPVTTPPDAETPDATTGQQQAEADHDAAAQTGSSIPVRAAIGLGALSSISLAVGLKRGLARRRRRAGIEQPGTIAAPTPPELHEVLRTVVAQADEDHVDELHLVLGQLALALAEARSSRRPRLVRHGADGTEIVLDQPDPNAVSGWTANEDGTVWTHTDPTVDEPVVACPTPLLVTIGEPEPDARLYLDLEADGLIALTGDHDRTTALARSILTELALSPFADTLRVVAIGALAPPSAAILGHLTVVETWDEVADDLTSWATQSHSALDDNDWPTTFVARVDDPHHDALTPLVVIADTPPPLALVGALAVACPSAVTVVALGDFDVTTARIHCEPDHLTFDRIDLSCTPQVLDPEELVKICELLAAADELVDPDDLEEHAEAQNSADSEGCPDSAALVVDADEAEGGDPTGGPPDYTVLVHLLGDIRVEGSHELKPKATSVVAYLALHRSVTTDRLANACWYGSDSTTNRKRLRDTMTEVRHAVGSRHFPANRGGAYAVGPEVITDLDLFNWHVQRAAEMEREDSLGHYETALALVTGVPFTYANAARQSFAWVDLEHHSTDWEHRIGQVALVFTEGCLDVEDPGRAVDVLRRLSRALPLDSTVVEALVRAHLAQDDQQAAERVYEEHVSALDRAGLGEPPEGLLRLRENATR